MTRTGAAAVHRRPGKFFPAAGNENAKPDAEDFDDAPLVARFTPFDRRN
jgi:hypothetical protein